MGKIIDLEKVKSEFVRRNYIPLFDKYTNCKTKLSAKTLEGYFIVICLDHLRQGRVPKIVDTNNPYTINNIKLWIKLNNKPYILLDNEYIGCTNLMEFVTLEGYKFQTNWTNLQVGCDSWLFSSFNKYTIKNIKLWLINNDLPYELLSTTYECSHQNLKFNCDKHGVFQMAWSNMQRRMTCKQCGIESKSGENCYLWKGGISDLHVYLRHKVDKWKMDSFKKYNFKCDITGSTKNKIVHHLYGFDQIVKETLDILNLPIYQEINKYTNIELKQLEDECLELHYKYGLGVCLCEEEHKLFHATYGYGNNTPQQFEEFKKLRLEQLMNNI